METDKFKEILKETIKNFREKDKIGYLALFGSLRMERDIDMAIGPAKNIKKGEFLKILCNFLEILSKTIEKEGARLIVATHSLFEDEVKYLSKLKIGKDVLLHMSSFPDFITLDNLSKGILETAHRLYGDVKNIKNIPQTDKERYYNYLLFSNCLYSHYPRELETNKVHEKVSYIYKHNKGIINLQNKTNKQIYFECCDFLDATASFIG